MLILQAEEKKFEEHYGRHCVTSEMELRSPVFNRSLASMLIRKE